MTALLAVVTPINERYIPVSAPARALALDIRTAADRLSRDLGGLSATPHGLADAEQQMALIKALLVELAFEMGEHA